MKDELTLKDLYYFLIFLFLSLLVIISGGGADFLHYLKWSEYFSKYNLEIFFEYPKSQNGLPLVAWYYGIGLITSLISKLFFFKGLMLVKVCSSLLVIFNFFLIYKISNFYKIKTFNFLFLVSLIYLILPAGYYLNKFSSETWSIFLTLLSILLIEQNIKNLNSLKSWSLIIFGIILYFLILIKITNIFLCFSLLLIFYIKKFNNIPIKINNIKKNLRILFIGFFFLILSISLLLIYHKLLTGNFLSSPYSYGNNDFSSFSIKNFKVLEVLFSSWHGLFFYHPIYLFSFFLLLIILYKNFSIVENTKWIVLIVFSLFLLHILIQSSHATWWMGLGTYGSRGFAGISILTFYVFLNIKDTINIKDITLLNKVLLTTILGYQSFILSLGETNFFTFDSFTSFLSTAKFYQSSISIVFIIGFSFIFKIIFKLDFLKFIKILVVSLAFFSAISIFLSYKKSYYIILISVLSSYFISYFVQSNSEKFDKISRNFFHISISLIFSILFIFSIYAQSVLFIQYKKNINPSYYNKNNFDCREAIGSYVEYNNLQGYKKDKKKWLNFLSESGCI